MRFSQLLSGVVIPALAYNLYDLNLVPVFFFPENYFNTSRVWTRNVNDDEDMIIGVPTISAPCQL